MHYLIGIILTLDIHTIFIIIQIVLVGLIRIMTPIVIGSAYARPRHSQFFPYDNDFLNREERCCAMQLTWVFVNCFAKIHSAYILGIMMDGVNQNQVDLPKNKQMMSTNGSDLREHERIANLTFYVTVFFSHLARELEKNYIFGFPDCQVENGELHS